MYAMQYEISLPADYDMDIIRHRVKTSGGPMMDEFAGLGVKAFVLRERGVDGSPVNEYAPFYLWSDVDGMRRFLLAGEDGFGRIVASFGRPVVRHWLGVTALAGPAAGTAPAAASKHTESLPPDADPRDVLADAGKALTEHARRAGVHTTALAVDPATWELVRFTLWHDVAPDEDPVRYQVLHVAAPELGSVLG